MSAMKMTWIGLLCSCFVALGCKDKAPTPTPMPTPPVATNGQAKPPVKTAKLKITDLKVGTGREAKPGDTVWMAYRGTLKNGTEFDSNVGKDKDPFAFTIGEQQVIKGWDEGIPGMRVGGKRKLEVPANLAYGAQAQGKIPPNSDLNFEVELLGIVKPGEERVIDTTDLKQGNGRVAKEGDTVAIKYTAMLTNGRVFDTASKPYSFTIGEAKTLPAIEEGVTGMKVGGKRRITAPPAVAYGTGGQGRVPPASLVIFEVELLSIK